MVGCGSASGMLQASASSSYMYAFVTKHYDLVLPKAVILFQLGR